MKEIEESILTGHPNAISYECTKKIIEQMEKNICRIKIGQNQGTGFFCKIPFPDKVHMLPVFITNYHLINEQMLDIPDKKIDIYIREEREPKEINLNNRIKYTNKQFDTTIIELKEKDDIKNYLELDDIILDGILNNINNNKEYEDKTVYIIQYPKGILSVSYGILKKKKTDYKYNFNHLCCTERGSSGSPILNINNKLIGIHHKGGNEDINYNKGTFLNYPIKEFIEKNCKNNFLIINNNVNEINEIEKEKLIKEMNIKYDLKIKDNKIHELYINDRTIGDEIFQYIDKLEFKQLKELYLQYDWISNINALKNAKFEKLERLKLTGNDISDINILEKVNFPELKDLSFYYNKISDIKVLENVNFEKLEYLNFGKNKLSDISILEKVNFKDLKILHLDNNKISDINVLANVKFEKLELLDLSYNKISDIVILEKVNFKELKELNLSKNKISDINILEKVEFKELKDLNLNQNNISDINVLEKVKFEKLELLDLSHNKIPDINIFYKTSFKGLKKLYLNNNEICDIQVLKKFSLEELNIKDNKIEGLKNYAIIRILKYYGTKIDK